MEIIAILLFLILWFLYFIYKDLRKMKILAEAPKSYRENIEKNILYVDETISSLEREMRNVFMNTGKPDVDQKEIDKKVRELREKMKSAVKQRNEIFDEFYRDFGSL